MSQRLTTAEFFGTPVSIIGHDGQQWLTAEQAERSLDDVLEDWMTREKARLTATLTKGGA